MKIINLIMTILLVFSIALTASEKRVLVEIFTNSHCPLCPSAHSTMDSYLQSPNGDKIEYIYYHMSFPYSDDQLYQHNPEDSQSKNSFYGPHSSTPKAYFDGTLVSNSYSNWAGSLDILVTEESIFDLILSGNFDDNSFTVNAEITRIGSSDGSEFTINYVVVEDVIYDGRNGISSHKNIMRKIVNPEGEIFSINQDETKTLSATIDFNEEWNSENLSIVVFIQNKDTKEIYQSGSIDYSSLVVTSVEELSLVENKFSLLQNYPNPFNPTTVIQYNIPRIVEDNRSSVQNVELKIYDILGKEVVTLVNEDQNPGKYSVVFNANNLSAGFYYYQLKAGNFTQTRKMILLK